MAAMADVTFILAQIEAGDLAATEQLLPLVYDELRQLASYRLAKEKPGQTLQATALVHEAYLRLVGSTAAPVNAVAPEIESNTYHLYRWNSRGHFFAAAAEAMRRILVEQARKKQAAKRGGARQRSSLTEAVAPEQLPPWELLALNEALEQLARDRPEHAALVQLRFFAGLTLEDAAASLGISPATAKRRWTWARAWLFGKLADKPADD